MLRSQTSAEHSGLTTLFTIGYQSHTIDSFVTRLKESDVQLVIDVRQNPQSRKRSFSKTKLGLALDQFHIEYLHLPRLGTPAAIRTVYGATRDVRGALANYECYLSEQLESIHELVSAAQMKRSCLMCLESNHQLCHRSIIAARISEITGWHLTHL